MLTNGFDKIFVRELRRIKNSKSLLFGGIIGPLFSFLLISLIFIKGVPEDIPVAVVDNDKSSLSHKISSYIDATSIAKVVESDNLSDAKKLMEEGKAEAIIFLQENLERDVVRGDSPQLPVFINNTNIVKGGMLKKGIYQTLATVNAGVKISVRTKKSFRADRIMSSVRPIPLDVHLLHNPHTSYMYFVGIALLAVMLIAFTMLTNVYALGKEIRTGSCVELLRFTKGKVLPVIMGKLLPYTLIFSIQAFVLNLLMFRFLSVPLNGSLGLIVISEIVLVMAYQAMAVVLISITYNMRLGLSLGAAYTMMALSFSGLTFPALGMPAVAKVFSWFFPYTYWLEMFISQSLKSVETYIALYNLFPMLLFIGLAILLAPRIKHIITEERYWYKK